MHCSELCAKRGHPPLYGDTGAVDITVLSLESSSGAEMVRFLVAIAFLCPSLQYMPHSQTRLLALIAPKSLSYMRPHAQPPVRGA